jgi:hypothetical protein
MFREHVIVNVTQNQNIEFKGKDSHHKCIDCDIVK